MLSGLIVRASWWRFLATAALTASAWFTIWFRDWVETNLGASYALAYVIISCVCSFVAVGWVIGKWNDLSDERLRAEVAAKQAASVRAFEASIAELTARGLESPLKLVRAWRVGDRYSGVLVQVDDGTEVFACQGTISDYKRVDGKPLTPLQQAQVDAWGYAEWCK